MDVEYNYFEGTHHRWCALAVTINYKWGLLMLMQLLSESQEACQKSFFYMSAVWYDAQCHDCERWDKECYGGVQNCTTNQLQVVKQHNYRYVKLQRSGTLPA